MGIGDVLGKKDRLERHCMILSDGNLGPVRHVHQRNGLLDMKHLGALLKVINIDQHYPCIIHDDDDDAHRCSTQMFGMGVV